MLRKLYFLLPVISLGLLVACKDDNNNDNKPDTGSCPPGTDFCMKYGGEQKSGIAELSEPGGTNPRVLITWQDVSNGVEQVELSIYGNGTGDYVVDTTRATGTAYFEYFNSNLNETTVGVSGTVKVTGFDPSQKEVGVTGSFDLTVDDGTKVTDGHFLQVDKP